MSIQGLQTSKAIIKFMEHTTFLKIQGTYPDPNLSQIIMTFLLPVMRPTSHKNYIGIHT